MNCDQYIRLCHLSVMRITHCPSAIYEMQYFVQSHYRARSPRVVSNSQVWVDIISKADWIIHYWLRASTTDQASSRSINLRCSGAKHIIDSLPNFVRSCRRMSIHWAADVGNAVSQQWHVSYMIVEPFANWWFCRYSASPKNSFVTANRKGRFIHCAARSKYQLHDLLRSNRNMSVFSVALQSLNKQTHLSIGWHVNAHAVVNHCILWQQSFGVCSVLSLSWLSTQMYAVSKSAVLFRHRFVDRSHCGSVPINTRRDRSRGSRGMDSTWHISPTQSRGPSRCRERQHKCSSLTLLSSAIFKPPCIGRASSDRDEIARASSPPKALESDTDSSHDIRNAIHSAPANMRKTISSKVELRYLGN